MAGLVIIDNSRNVEKQIGETSASWLLRMSAHITANAINKAVRTAIELSKPEKKYQIMGSFAPDSEYHRLQTKDPEISYQGMRFLQDKIPVNNLILKSKNNEFIEFVNAKIDVIKQNTIIETALVNRRGKIKEYITALDYEIKITGDIMVSENYYPTYEIGEINDFLSEPDEFDIVNTYLEAFEITKVVFKNGNFNQQKQKHFNVLPFDFTFVSDEDTDNAYGLIIEN